jgi:hypothetical protein
LKRRGFIGGAATVAGILSCPAWITRAFAQTTDTDPLGALSEAYRRAQRAGRPLLVIVIPDDSEQRWIRQSAFGELLNHAPAAMRDLALAEVACASMATLRTLVPQAGTGEPLMVLVEPEGVPAAVRRLDAVLPDVPSLWIETDVELTWEERERREDAIIDRRIAILSGLVHDALAGTPALVAHRAALARERLTDVQRAQVDAAVASGGADRATAALAPAVLYHAAATGRAPGLDGALEDLGTERWRRGRIPGSRWASGGGCGISIEGDTSDGRFAVACGMGHVPERSARFLYWFGS